MGIRDYISVLFNPHDTLTENPTIKPQTGVCMPTEDKTVEDVLSRYDFTEAKLRHYNLAHAHAQELSLPQRIRLCVALLEPELTLEGSKLYRAVVMLKELL